MTGLYIFLGIVGGIILLFIAILSIPLNVYVSYDQYIGLRIRWFFLKFTILPIEDKPKKPKKEKKKKAKPQGEQPAAQAAPKEKKPNPIMDMVKANGYDGMMEILGNLGSYLGKMGKAFIHAIRFTNLTIHVITAKGDAAQTAIEYGKACQKVFPLAGFICANYLVSTYDVWVEPDYLANSSQGEFFADMRICPRKIVNGGIAMVFRMIFGVGLKFFINSKKKDKSTEKSTNDNPQPKDGAASHERMATQ